MYIQDVNGINFIQQSRGVNSQNRMQQGLEIFKFNSSAQPSRKAENIDSLIENSIKDGSLAKILEETIPDSGYRAKVLEILNPANENIVCIPDDNDPGAAQWDKESGRIVINTSSKSEVNGFPRKNWDSTPAGEKLKLLIHEAMHGAQNSSFNTQEEEMLCEMTAIKTATILAREKNLPDVPLYPPSYTLQTLGAMNEEELRKVLESKFISNGYTNRIKDETGAVKITGSNGTGIDIPAGSKIFVGEREYEIGEVFIEGRGANSGTVCNFFTLQDGKIRGLGVITFDDIKPAEHELNNPQQQRFLNPQEHDYYNNAVIVIDGKEYNMKIFDFTP